MTGATIYVLFKQNEIVYVGQSINPYNRIGQHTKDKDFDHFRVMPCLKKRMAYWEKYLIYKYQPKYNVVGKEKGDRIVKQVAKEEPKVEYQGEPLFINNSYNVGYGYVSAAGSRLVIDGGRTSQSNVYKINNPIRVWVEDNLYDLQLFL